MKLYGRFKCPDGYESGVFDIKKKNILNFIELLKLSSVEYEKENLIFDRYYFRTLVSDQRVTIYFILKKKE